jgi:hypothetical protein
VAVHGFSAEVWLWEADAAWHFLTLPEDASDDIESRAAGRLRGFGSVRVRATIGTTTWQTSVFPDKKRGAYVLPLKKEVRTREGFGAGDRVRVELEPI